MVIMNKIRKEDNQDHEKCKQDRTSYGLTACRPTLVDYNVICLHIKISLVCSGLQDFLYICKVEVFSLTL
jgi:hypothetical protein